MLGLLPNNVDCIPNNSISNKNTCGYAQFALEEVITMTSNYPLPNTKRQMNKRNVLA
jgi:hypothetical protein